MDKLRTVLVGCGLHAKTIMHTTLDFIEEIEVVACCDLDKEKALYTAKRFGLKEYFTNLDKMLESVQAEAAIIISYPNVQAELTKKCLEAGLHVFCEKPIVTSMAEAKMLQDIQNKYPEKHIVVGFQKRFAPYTNKIKDIITKKEFGKASYIFAKFANGYRESTSELLRVGAIHSFDLAHYLIGDVDEVFTHTYEQEDGKVNFAVSVKFLNGAVGNFYLSSLGTWSSKGVEYLEVRGDQNYVILDNLRELTWQKAPLFSAEKGTTDSVEQVPSPSEYLEPNYSHVTGKEYLTFYQNGYGQILEEFAKNIINGNDPKSDLKDGIKCLKMALAVEKSMNTGLPVKI